MQQVTEGLAQDLGTELRNHPVKFVKVFWPSINLYKEQRLIMESVRDNDETVVAAGNKLGKDFVSGLIGLWFFLTRHPVRIVTTSTDYSQLQAVLWGEIKRLISTSKYALSHTRGGPIVDNHLYLRKIVNGAECGVSYMIGRVAAKGEGMQGHHVTPESGTEYDPTIPRTLYMCDEASGVDQESYVKAETWSARKLIIGNPWPCDNFFYHAIEGRREKTEDGAIREIPGGDIPDPDNPGRYFRKVFEMGVEYSPNIRYAKAELEMGLKPSGKIITPGVKDWSSYQQNLAKWDAIQICVCLHGKFYKGGQLDLYPDELIQHAVKLATKPYSVKNPSTMGVDTGQGVANTVWTLGNEYGITDQISKKTADTSVIPDFTIELIRRYNLDPSRVAFDMGGGGKEHSDQCRRRGYKVRVIAFGGGVTPGPRAGRTPIDKRKEVQEEVMAFKNKRAMMFYSIRQLLLSKKFGIPGHLNELIYQMSKIPILYDKDGQLYVPPKNKKEGSNEQTLIDLIGYSPDELDSFAILAYLLTERSFQARAGVPK